MTDDLVARLRDLAPEEDDMPVTRRVMLESASRVRELEAENRRMAERLGLLAVGFGVPDGGRYIADWQTKIDKFKAAEARVRELEAELAAMEARAVAADLAAVKAAKVATTEAYERAAEVADCHADECDAASFASTVADQVSALRSKEQAAHDIAAAIRNLAQEGS